MHELYLKHLQELEGEMVDNGYDHFEVVKVLTVFIHSVVHNLNIDEKLFIYNKLLNHFFEVVDNLHKEKEGEENRDEKVSTKTL